MHFNLSFVFVLFFLLLFCFKWYLVIGMVALWSLHAGCMGEYFCLSFSKSTLLNNPNYNSLYSLWSGVSSNHLLWKLLWEAAQRASSPTNVNSVDMFSSLSCLKSILLSFICGKDTGFLRKYKKKNVFVCTIKVSQWSTKWHPINMNLDLQKP